MIDSMRILAFWRWLFLTMVLLVGLSEGASVHAQTGVTLTAEAGFDSYSKENQWLPIRVTIENNSVALDGRVETEVTSDNGSRTIYAETISLPAVSRKQLTLYIFPSPYLTELTIVFRTPDGIVANTDVSLNPIFSGNSIFGILADNPSAYNILADLDPPNGNAYVALLSTDELPERIEALQILDTIIISGIDSGEINSRQLQVLENWIAAGGCLVITGGTQWQATTAGLGGILPIIPSQTHSLTNLESLEAYSQSTIPLIMDSTVPVVTGPAATDAQILVSQDGIPIVIRQSIGWGQVFFLAFDPSIEPFRTWDGMADLYRMLFSYYTTIPAWGNGIISMDAAQEVAVNIPNLMLPSTLLICGFLGAYMVILGPVNYFILRWLKRREMAWITIPALVVVFSLIAILVGNISRGSQPVLNRLTVVQAWPETGQAVAEGVVGIYSPRRATFQIQAEADSLIHSISGFSLSQQEIDIVASSNTIQIPDLRIPVGGTQSLIHSGNISSPDISDDLSITIDENGVVLRGTLTNNSLLTYSDVVLLFPGGILPIGDFTPGDVRGINIPLTQAQFIGGATPRIQPITGFSIPVTPYSSVFDSTITDIIGTSNYYDDREAYRRYLLLNTHLAYNTSIGRGGGIYLTGWTDTSPLELTLLTHQTRTLDTSLYIFSLSPDVQISGSPIVLSPGAFTWNVLPDSNTSSTSPYQIYLYTNEYLSLIFSLAHPVAYTSTDRLEIHLTSNTQLRFPSELDVFLWDFEQAQWIQQDIGNWGTYSIDNPDRYVSTGGDIQLRIHNTGMNYLDLSTADISLVVEP